ncbi:hypothetical protein ACFO4L_01430 [Bacillus daqingensis]|uniref:Uncharacterized protein n=2 Tax=Bacillaceae TaxID=186817 RepID=A0A969TUX0_9BACI|nr:hypothetical protein [Alkalicoccus luteus]NJP37507.1 hypothetical protein [Alkalicoccus luteus]
MKGLLELVRVICIMLAAGAAAWWIVLEPLYSVNSQVQNWSWIGAMAVFVFIFVLYRNRWQFSGWYTGPGREKLSRPITTALVAIAGVMIIIPFLSLLVSS